MLVQRLKLALTKARPLGKLGTINAQEIPKNDSNTFCQVKKKLYVVNFSS